MAARRTSTLVSLLGFVVLAGWGIWRVFLIAGGPWKAGHSCASVVTCRTGLCLVHAREHRGGALTTVSGYCSDRCKSDADCPKDMVCEPLPAGISRKAGDHLPIIKLPERLCVRIVASPDAGR